jgi:hypothetical protein
MTNSTAKPAVNNHSETTLIKSTTSFIALQHPNGRIIRVRQSPDTLDFIQALIVSGYRRVLP